MMKLRPFEPADAEAIVSWIRDEETFRRWCADRYDHFPFTADDLRAAYAGAGDSFFPVTAWDEAGVQGHLVVRMPVPDQPEARFGFVIVNDARRGCGLGREMLLLAEQYAREKLGVVRLTLGVFARNEQARRCYERVGFSAIPGGETSYRIGNEDWICVEMEKHLGQ